RRGPCVWNIFRGDAHRAVWLAALLFWSRSAQSLVAIPLGHCDAQGPRLASFTSRANSRHGGNSQTAFSLGNVRGAFCLQLSFLFSAYLAADLSCSRTPFLDAKNGQSRWGGLPHPGCFRTDRRLDFRLLACRWRQSDSSTQVVYSIWAGVKLGLLHCCRCFCVQSAARYVFS